MKRVAILSLLYLLLASCSPTDPPSISLYLALHRGDLNQVERHIRAGTDLNQLDVDGQAPLHVAARRGRIAIAKLLLEHGADPNRPNAQGESPLHTALAAGRTELAELLLRRGAKFDPARLLLDLSRIGIDDRDVIRFLIRKGAQINQPDESGRSALLIAVQQDALETAKYLIQYGADVNQAMGNGTTTALQLATQRNNQDMIALLRRNGAR